MQKFVDKNEIIKIPHIFTTLKFSLKSDHELDLLHHFFIKAISENVSVADIANAINLPENIVLEEFTQMCNQGYINSEHKLTDYAKEYLAFVNFIDEVKKQSPSLYINLLDGKFTAELSSETGSDFIEAKPKISQKEIENLGFWDFKDFLSAHFDFFRDKSPEFIAKLSECISVEFKFKNNFDFDYIHAKKIPCYAGSFSASGNKKTATARGIFYHYEFKCIIDSQLKFKYFEAKKKQKNNISITHEEKKLISEFDMLQKDENKIFQCWVDSVSGNIIFDIPSSSNRKNENIVLKEYIKRTNELDNNVLHELMKKKNLTSNHKLKPTLFERIPYYVSFDFKEIQYGGDEICRN